MDKINTDQLAICPSCGAAMHFSRIVPSIDGLPEMQTFECRPCQLAITRSGMADRGAIANLAS